MNKWITISLLAWTLSACGGSATEEASSIAIEDASTAEATPVVISEAALAKIDKELAIFNQQMPIKAGAVDLTAIKRIDNTVFYTFTYTGKRVTFDNFDVQASKTKALGECQSMMALLNQGLSAQYIYIFADKRQKEVLINKADCDGYLNQ